MISVFEYMGWTVSIDKVVGDGGIHFVWSAVRNESPRAGSGKSATYQEAENNARAYIDGTGTQPLYG